MTPLNLLLRGLAGIRAGLGKDEFFLDLERLAPEARIVAIVGPNGAGKSTVIDNLHPYRIMPSRSTSLSSGGFSFYDHLVGAEALKQLEWQHMGRRYRSTLVFKMNGKRRTEAYVHEMIDGALKPARLDDGTVSNGSTENYDRIIEGLLGSSETFFTSAFSAQNRKPLSSYGNTEVKSLMVDLLGLRDIRDHGEKASAVVRSLRLALDEKRNRLKAQENVDAQLEKARTEQLEHEKRELEVSARLTVRQEAVGQAQRSLGEAQAAARGQESVVLRRGAIEAGINAEAERESLERKEHARRLRELQAQKCDIEIESEVRRKATSEKSNCLRDEMRSADQLISKEKEVRAAREQIEELVAAVSKSRSAVEEAEERAVTANALREERALLTERIHGLEQQAGAAALRTEELKQRLRLTEEVPCHGTHLQQRCKLLSEANAARPILPCAEADLRRLAEERRVLQAQSKRLQSDLQPFGDVKKTVSELRNQLDKCQQQHAQAVSLFALEPGIEAARKRRTQVESDLGTLSAETERLQLSDRRKLNQLAEEARLVNEQFSADQASRDGRLAVLQQELSSIPVPDTTLEPRAEEALRVSRAQLQLTELELREALEKKAEASARVAVLSAASGEAVVLRDQVAHLQEEIGWWSLLVRALGNDGIIALCIDDAGPSLAHLTNELLMSCYGPRFTVSIRTQLETAKGGQREGFDVVVFDAQAGSSQSLTVMSGGEKVWINECLTRAVALYLAQGSACHFDTLFCDETDGALDPDRKKMFMQMKREVLQIGGYQREFCITQTNSLAELADAVIDLTRERSQETCEWSDSAIKYA